MTIGGTMGKVQARDWKMVAGEVEDQISRGREVDPLTMLAVIDELRRARHEVTTLKRREASGQRRMDAGR